MVYRKSWVSWYEGYRYGPFKYLWQIKVFAAMLLPDGASLHKPGSPLFVDEDSRYSRRRG